MSTIAGTVIVKPDAAPAETKSGIILPESMTTEINIGTVLHVGRATTHMKPEVKPGDTIVFNHKTYRKQSFVLDNDDVMRIGFQDVILIKHNQ